MMTDTIKQIDHHTFKIHMLTLKDITPHLRHITTINRIPNLTVYVNIQMNDCSLNEGYLNKLKATFELNSLRYSRSY